MGAGMALFLIMMTSVPAGQDLGSAVPLTAEPHHHLALANPYTRVFKVEVAPHSATLNHHHDHDYVFVILGDAEIENQVEGKSPSHSKMSDGQVTLIAGGFSHVARNLSERPFRNVTIEILKPPAAQAAAPGLDVGAGTLTDAVLDNLSVRATEVKLLPGATLPSRPLLPHLLVAITDLTLAGSGPTRRLQLRSGDIAWEDSGKTGSLTNAASAPATILQVEFK